MEDARMISPYIPFPNIYWWTIAAGMNEVCFDEAEHFVKMTYRNRYYISGSNGLVQLSIPLQHGRDQRTAMRDLSISTHERWQVQHWRTLFSVYNRSPFFEYYAPSLEELFLNKYQCLTDFNLATVRWLKEQLKFRFGITNAVEYVKQYENVFDMRVGFKPGVEKSIINAGPAYYQVFADRTGFLPNLSMLDLLFAEGPSAAVWLNNNKKEIIANWGGRG